jgi:spermidine synthase
MKKIQILFAIFFITLSVILIEILYTRVFSVIYYSSFAFLMISLALFGSGLSGVFMSLSKLAEKKNAIKYLEYIILAFAVLLPIVYKITLIAKVDFLNLFSPITNLIPLLINFLVLLVPFFLAGVALVLIFTLYSDEIGKLYFIDLVGAALGGLAIIPLITWLGPSKIILLISAVFLVLWFSISHAAKLRKYITFAVLAVAFVLLFKFAMQMFPVVPKIIKRGYIIDYNKKRIEHSKWSPINKIDVAPFALGRQKKIIWLNGGTQQSWLIKTHRNEINENMKTIKWIKEALPYQLTRKNSALIIGSAGGFETLCAISNRFKHVVAVEMDPEICDIVKNTYADHIGNIYDLKGVHLLNDEGRSVLKRLNRKYDVIQMVNSHNSDSLLSGGLSIAETYIYTVESFKDYWNHLYDDGFVSIIHIFGERMFSTAFQALREMGVPNPEKKFFIIQPEKGFNHFFMKKGDIDEEDIQILSTFADKRSAAFKKATFEIFYSPDRKMDNLYYKLASPDYQDVIDQSSVNISPVRDNSPYFNQPNKIGQLSFSNNLLVGWGKDIVKVNKTYSNSVYLSILFISILLSLVLIYLPLKMKSGTRADKRIVLFFFLIGLAFIIVEIILIKIFQLFLGSPAYSISVIIFSLLVSSGIGSLLSDRITRKLKQNSIFYLAVFVFLVLVVYSFFLFKAVYLLIKLGLVFRFLVTVALISVIGLPMGIFFPTAIKRLGETNKSMIGWAWGANAFATVLGSVLTVIIAINWNFTVAMMMGAAGYLLAGFIYRKAQEA